MKPTNKLNESVYFLMHLHDLAIVEKIKVVLKGIMISEREVEKHLDRHSLKYLWVIDQILTKNLQHQKTPKSAQVIDYKSLYWMTNKVVVKLQNQKTITLARLILQVLQDAKLIKKTKEHDRLKGVAAEFRVEWVNQHRYNSYPLRYISPSKMQLSFIMKVEAFKRGNIDGNSQVKLKMLEWMEKLDFSRINRPKLSNNHKIILEYFESYKFQVQGATGRIYNNFTNLPRKIREYTLIEGLPLGEIDIANAQAIFLSDIVLNELHKKGEEPSVETMEFINWTQLGKSFEFIKGKAAFESSQKRNVYKKKFWQCVMDKNEKMESYKDVYDNMILYMPQMVAVIKMMKRSNHKVMARELQKAESELMVAVFEKIMVDKTCSLLHDAIYFPSNIWKKILTGFLEEVKSRKIQCTIKVMAKFDHELPRNGVYLTFEPDVNQMNIIQNNIELFAGYPPELLKNAKLKFGKSVNEDFYNQFESESVIMIDKSLLLENNKMDWHMKDSALKLKRFHGV